MDMWLYLYMYVCLYVFVYIMFLNFALDSFVWQIYKRFGLNSSYAQVMKFGCLLTYSEYGAANRDFPEVPPNLLEDIYQVLGRS